MNWDTLRPKRPYWSQTNMRNYLVMTLDQDRRSRTNGRITPVFVTAPTRGAADRMARTLADSTGTILIDTVPLGRIQGSNNLFSPTNL